MRDIGAERVGDTIPHVVKVGVTGLIGVHGSLVICGDGVMRQKKWKRATKLG